MLVKNDKFKMIAPISGFDYVGTVFTVTNISEEGVITIGCSFGTGIMSYDEFVKYFEKYVEPVKLKWSNWIVKENYHYKTNNKHILVKLDGIKASASCHKSDTFDLETGINICLARIEVKKAKDKLNNIIKAL